MVSYENENQWAVQYPAIVFQAWKNKFHSRLHQTSPKHASYRRATTEGDPSRRGDVFVRTKLQLLVRLTTTLNRRPPEASRRQLPTASLHGTRRKRARADSSMRARSALLFRGLTPLRVHAAPSCHFSSVRRRLSAVPGFKGGRRSLTISANPAALVIQPR